MQETQVPLLGQENALKEEVATHSSILAWEIPRTEEPGGLQSTGLQSQTQLSPCTRTREVMVSHILFCCILGCVFSGYLPKSERSL